MHPRSLALLALVLPAWSPDAREVRLADVNLTNPAIKEQIRARLDPADRPAFGIFVTRHLVYAAGFCGQRLTDAAGREPVTIGDAIAMTRARDALAARLAAQAARPLTPAEQARANRQSLVDQIDVLLSRRDALAMQPGGEGSAEARDVAIDLAKAQQQLAAMPKP